MLLTRLYVPPYHLLISLQDIARAALEEAERIWKKKRTEVMDGAQKTIDDYLREVALLEKQVGYAQKDYDQVRQLFLP